MNVTLAYIETFDVSNNVEIIGGGENLIGVFLSPEHAEETITLKLIARGVKGSIARESWKRGEGYGKWSARGHLLTGRWKEMEVIGAE